jgi:hypothetical protein
MSPEATNEKPSGKDGAVHIEPHASLTSILERIVAGHPQSRIDELMPWVPPGT